MVDNKEENKSSDNKHLEALMKDVNAEELLAMELKILGIQYSQIAQKINKTEESVKHYFRTDGKLFSVYEKYKEHKLKELQKEAIDLSKAHVKTAIECLIGVMAQKESHAPRVKAAQEILERVIGKVPNVNVNFDQEGYDELAEKYKKILDIPDKEPLKTVPPNEKPATEISKG